MIKPVINTTSKKYIKVPKIPLFQTISPFCVDENIWRKTTNSKVTFYPVDNLIHFFEYPKHITFTTMIQS